MPNPVTTTSAAAIDRPWVVRMMPTQPLPQQTLVCHTIHQGPASTAIARVWTDDDYMRCSLCQNCQLRANPPGEGAAAVCLVVPPAKVEAADAPLFESLVVASPNRRNGDFIRGDR